MVDYLAYLGISAAWNFVFSMVIEDLAKDTAKDFVKDFCKDSLKDVLLSQDEWQKAVTQALKEFLEQVENELVGAGETELSCKAYAKSLQSFLRHPPVRLTLGSAVIEELPVDSRQLAQAWNELKLERLPDDFDWAKLCRRYQNKALAIFRDSEKLRSLLDSRHTAQTAQAVQQLAGLNPGFDTAQYADSLKRRYSHLKLETLDANPDHQPIRLTQIFVEQTVRSCQQFNPRIHELPIEHRRRLQKKGALEWELAEEYIDRQRESFLQQLPQPVLEVVGDTSQRLIVVLGDPGSGKSMLLNTLAVQWAERRPVERASQPIPLLVELKAYIKNLQENHCRDILEYLDHGPGAVGQLDQRELDAALKHGSAIFLLDGLDEIFDPEARKEVASQLVRFCVRYPSARFLVTSRIIGYDLVAPILRDAGFQHYLLQELDEEQQNRFLIRWHELAYPERHERAEKLNRLRTSINDVAAIRELAENPLLLTLMALLNRHQELPRDRNELYEQASRILLQQWDATKALKDDPLLAEYSLDYKDKQAILRAVAFRMQTEAEGLTGNLLAETDLEDTLIAHLNAQGYDKARPLAVRLIRQLRERNFILCLLGDDYFAFVHRTFLEFFCAWAWVWRFEKEKSLTFEQLEQQTFAAHWADEKWHEVLRLIAARLEPRFAEQLILKLLDRKDFTYRFLNVFLATKCYTDLRNPSAFGVLSERLEQELKALTQIELPFYYGEYDEETESIAEFRGEAVRAIGICWPMPQTRQWLLDNIQDKNSKIRSAALRELARSWKAAPGTQALLSAYTQSNEEPSIREVALQELARGWKGEPDTLALLKTIAEPGQHWIVRRAALQELVRGWKELPDTLVFVKTITQSDQDPDIRSMMLRELAQNWKNEPDTLTLIKACAQSDQDWFVRLAALQELARAWKDDPDTLILLKGSAPNTHNQTDEDFYVSGKVLRELARGWKDDTDTLDLLKISSQSDQDTFVRQAALQELARGWKDEPGTQALIKACAQFDEDVLVQEAALQELARGWKDDPDTLALLKDSAQSDLNWLVCQVALQELARGWKSDPDTLILLMSHAQPDESSKVRNAALRELARGWGDDPDVAAFLRESKP
jgi:hypothetical protein